jgi:hypothetical protein
MYATAAGALRHSCAALLTALTPRFLRPLSSAARAREPPLCAGGQALRRFSALPCQRFARLPLAKVRPGGRNGPCAACARAAHASSALRQARALTARSSGVSQSLHGGWASFVGLRAVDAAQECVPGLAERAWCAYSAWRRRRLGRERWVSAGHASAVPDGLDRAWLRRRTHMDRIGLARSGESVVAGSAGGGCCACEA